MDLDVELSRVGGRLVAVEHSGDGRSDEDVDRLLEEEQRLLPVGRDTGGLKKETERQGTGSGSRYGGREQGGICRVNVRRW